MKLKKWRLKRVRKGSVVLEDAFPAWKDMTRKEAETALSKFKGTYQPVFAYCIHREG